VREWENRHGVHPGRGGVEGGPMSLTVELPTCADDAVGLLADGGLVIAGGTVVMPLLTTRAHDVGTLVSLRGAGLAGIEVAGGVAEIGAATTLAQIGRDERLALLRPVVESIASPPLRNLATVAGNLFVHSGDLAVALLALDAEAEVAGPDGRERMPVSVVLDAGLAPACVVTSVRFALPPAGEFFYTKAMRRRLNSGSIVTVAAVLSRSDGVVTSARVALGVAGPRPLRAGAAEAALIGAPLSRERAEAAGAAAASAADPPTDAYASAWYRRRVIPVHVRRALLGERKE
jgi:CO/xanthine dehydrogenase FAD-binding subunit